MPNKYLVAGCSFCGKGDGPLIPTEAAHNDATGYAWGLTSTDTDAINILTGAAPKFGTALAAGDTVYIRSKTSAGADIAVTHTGVSLGSSAATTANRIRWVLDGGTIWSEVSGTLTYSGSAAAHQVIPRNFNIFISEVPHNWIFRNAAGSNYIMPLSADGFQHISGYGLFIDGSTSTGANTLLWTSSYCKLYLENCKFKGVPFVSNQSILFPNGAGAQVTLVNPTIELTHTCDRVFIAPNGTGATITVYGGQLIGAGATTGTHLVNADSWSCQARVDFIGFQFPQTVTPGLNAFNDAWPLGWRIMGADGGVGSVMREAWGVASSRQDGYFPYLNATIPNSTLSGWSWYVYPFDGCAETNPWTIPVGKFYTDTAAAKTVTAELLVGTAWGSEYDTSNLWMTVGYIDNSTGEMKHVSSKVHVAGTALSTSTAAWSATTYGAVNFNKRKISVTTPTSIKKDTMVFVNIYGGKKASASDKLIFVCPDVQLS